MPTLTVVVTTYNHAPFIARALESVLAQDIGDCEIVIGDDYSTDGTRDIVSAFQAAHPERVRLMFPPHNLGEHGNPLWLQCVGASRSDYIACLDGDDYWTASDKLRRQVDFLERHPEARLCFHNADVKTDGAGQPAWTLYESGLPDVWTLERILRRSAVPMSSVMLRGPGVEALRWLRTLDSKWLIDWSIAVLAATEGPLGYIDRVMSVFRQRQDGAWSGLTRGAQLALIVDIYDALRPRLDVTHNAVIDEEVPRRCYEAAGAFERAGRLHDASVYLSRCIAARPAWLETYAPRIGALGPDIWSALQRQVRRYDRPALYRVHRWARPIVDAARWAGVWLRQSWRSVARAATGKSVGELAAHPSWLRPGPSPTGTASTRLAWTTRRTDAVEIRVGGPTGPLVERGVRGSVVTGPWVDDRMRFVLVDTERGSTILDVARVRVAARPRSGLLRLIAGAGRVIGSLRRGAVAGAEALRWRWLAVSAAIDNRRTNSGDWITAHPNPAQRLAERDPSVTLTWQAAAGNHVEIRVGAPDGPCLTASGASGQVETGRWVRDGMTFYLQDASGGGAATAAATLATVSVAVADPPARIRRGRPVRFHVRRLLRTVARRGLPIRIVFLAQDPLDWWSLDSVYRACAADHRFNPLVVNAGFRDEGLQYTTDCAATFDRLGLRYIDGLDGACDLQALEPDVIVVSSPYDKHRVERYRSDELARIAKLVYIPYCIDYADKAGEVSKTAYGLRTHKLAWRIFARSPRTMSLYRECAGVSAHRIVCLGHPRIDRYYSDASPDVLPARIRAAPPGAFKIVYAPHHTLDGWSTFLRHGETIRRIVDERPDCFIVFRPHPYLAASLSHAGVMSEDTFRACFDGERTCLYEGEDYYELFRWSDLLISDASSFLVEYAPTRKPIIYLHREDGWGGLDDSLEEDVRGSCYVALDGDDIRRFVDELKAGRDPIRDERARHQENMSAGLFSGGAGQRIASYLAHELGCRDDI